MSTWAIARVMGGEVSATSPERPSRACRRRPRGASGPGQADFGGDAGERLDDEGDVGVEVHAELGGPAVDVVAVDRAGEALVLELLAHRGRLEAGDDLAGPHERAGVHEAGQLVAGIERAVQAGDARHPRVIGVGEDGVDDVALEAAGGEDLGAFQRMMRSPGVHLVVEVVEHAGDAPALGVFAEAGGIGPHRGLDRARVLAQAVALGELGQDRPRVVAGHATGGIRRAGSAGYATCRWTSWR